MIGGFLDVAGPEKSISPNAPAGLQMLISIGSRKEDHGGESAAIEPAIRIAESLRAAGDPSSKDSDPRTLLEKCSPHDTDFWERWVAIQFLDLGRTPAEALDDLPVEKHPSSYASDLRWLLDRLAAAKPIRIDCGGDERQKRDGRLWGRDRFFLSGDHGGWLLSRVERTQDSTVRLKLR